MVTDRAKLIYETNGRETALHVCSMHRQEAEPISGDLRGLYHGSRWAILLWPITRKPFRISPWREIKGHRMSPARIVLQYPAETQDRFRLKQGNRMPKSRHKLLSSPTTIVDPRRRMTLRQAYKIKSKIDQFRTATCNRQSIPPTRGQILDLTGTRASAAANRTARRPKKELRLSPVPRLLRCSARLRSLNHCRNSQKQSIPCCEEPLSRRS